MTLSICIKCTPDAIIARQKISKNKNTCFRRNCQYDQAKTLLQLRIKILNHRILSKLYILSYVKTTWQTYILRDRLDVLCERHPWAKDEYFIWLAIISS